MSERNRPRIVLLRGVNVGSHRQLSMPDLRTALLTIGFDAVETYIRSGNIVVEGGPDDDDTAAAVETVLFTRFGYGDVPVVVRTAEEMAHALRRSNELYPVDERPSVSAEVHGGNTHVLFFEAKPPPVRRASLDPDGFGLDRFQLDLHGRCADLHVSYNDGQSRSALTLDRVETAFGTRATGRNVKTVQRLLKMTEPE